MGDHSLPKLYRSKPIEAMRYGPSMEEMNGLVQWLEKNSLDLFDPAMILLNLAAYPENGLALLGSGDLYLISGGADIHVEVGDYVIRDGSSGEFAKVEASAFESTFDEVIL